MTVRKHKRRSGSQRPEAAKAAKVISVRLAPETIATLDAQAEALALSRSAYVARLVAERAREK